MTIKNISEVIIKRSQFYMEFSYNLHTIIFRLEKKKIMKLFI